MKNASVDIIIPIYNEEKVIESSVLKLRDFVKKNLPGNRCRIIVADNASTDKTLSIVKKLSKKYDDVGFDYIPRKGRGIALRTVWLNSKADMMCYMDADLSTELIALPKLVDAMESGYDLVYASRLSPESDTIRSFKRELLSRGYNLWVKMMLQTKFSDAQCGFKGITRKRAQEIIPWIKDNDWFFDTEMLVLGEKRGYKIFEIPVKWDEDPDTKVKIFRTVYSFLRDVIRLRFDLWFRKGLI